MSFFPSFFLRSSRALAILLLLLVSAAEFGWAQKSATPSLKINHIEVVPASFAGWKQTGSTFLRDAAQADASNAALLKEFGFSAEQRATYLRDGRKLELDALAFNDAGGAYGAYTFYLQPDAIKEDVGDEAASLSHGILFRKGNVLVRASFDQLTAMSAADLRELASAMPAPTGPQANLPALPAYLPKESLLVNSARYVAGPEAFNRLASPIPVQLVDFSRGAEVMAARYKLDDGNADLLLISYPTPQIAAERARAIESAMSTQAGIAVRRSGPLVVIANDAASPRDARSLAGAVHYDANVTWNEPTFTGPRNNIGSLVIACLALAGILIALALVAGIAFGGVRVLLKKLFPDRVFDRSRDVEIIRLKLEE